MNTNKNKSEQKDRIAIFQAEWPLQIHTTNIVVALAEDGFCVDLFLYKSDIIADIDTIEDHPRINVWHWSEPRRKGNIKWIQNFPSFFKRSIEFFYRLLRVRYKIIDIYERILFHQNNYSNLIPELILKRTLGVISGRSYRCFIGVEKLGLIWSFEVDPDKKVLQLYYSLELFEFNSQFCKTWHNKRIKKREEQIYRDVCLTIIQDKNRAKALNEFNGFGNTNFVYLPVSCTKQEKIPSKEKNNSFTDKIKMISFGQLDRYGKELVEVAQGFSPEWQLVLHDGLANQLWNKNKLIKQIQAIDKNNKLKLSLEKLNGREIGELIASAHIGLVFYPDTDINSYLTAFSSEKIALYLREGIPVITFAYEGYEIFEETLSGVTIKNLEQINSAIFKIIENYQEYSLNAKYLFKEKYDFDKNFSEVLRCIQELNSSSKVVE